MIGEGKRRRKMGKEERKGDRLGRGIGGREWKGKKGREG